MTPTGTEKNGDTVVDFEAFLEQVRSERPHSCALELCACAERRTLRDLASNLVRVRKLCFPKESDFILALITVVSDADDVLLDLENWAIAQLEEQEAAIKQY